ncbi:putative cold shock protein A [Rubripirellula lacrimiformis]|uniref:Putative cold shock protein A n=1 Tax=Rubripirellula lacrimiformis TaxID=1930273 RepID=A0A517N9Q4_9BACT|nr:putative cold shock protein A [Rubripirellula lacrimiformis]
MRYQGRIANWNDERGFGFIAPIDDGRRVFVHISSFSGRQRRPIENDMVTYEIGTEAKGRVRAERVVFADERLPWNTSFELGNVSLTFAGIFLVVLTGAVVFGKLPVPILGLYFVSSVVAFVAYSLDKSAAKQGRWRTQESTLHLLGLIGGWPGAAVAQSLLHHKSRKQSFQVVFWVTVVINCGALGWLFSPSGAVVLRSIFEISRG